MFVVVVFSDPRDREVKEVIGPFWSQYDAIQWALNNGVKSCSTLKMTLKPGMEDAKAEMPA
jgi:hypothetical protein